MKIIGTICLFMLLAMLSPGQETTIRQLYQAILSHPSGEEAPEAKGIDGKVDEVKVRALSEAEVDAILPFAFQCFRSPKLDVSNAGYTFLISAMLRFDSAKILEPYIDELGKLADEGDPSRRQRILILIGSLNPKLPDKAVEYLEANLESPRNSIQDAQTIAILLLAAAPTDASTVHKVLTFVSTHSDTNFTNSVLRQLGLSKIQFPEAVDFISANLNQEDRFVRASAVDAASRLDKDTRAQLSEQLSRIASDPKESQYVRQQAAQALKP